MIRKSGTILAIVSVCGVMNVAQSQGTDSKSGGDKIKVFLTAKDTPHRLSQYSPDEMAISKGKLSAEIRIDDSKQYQTIEGFGGAFTEATAYTLTRISPEKRAAAIKAYFDPEDGIGYTLCRTHINSCDFSLGNYAYVEKAGDVELKTFDISRDRRWLIPLIKDAKAVPGADFKMLASPWSPPAWMKTNGQMNHGGSLKPEYASVWALYFAKYIEAYAAEGIDIWGVTVQNEPAATQVWDSCIYSAQQERDFVRDHLGPTLERKGLGCVNIVVWDHNKDIIFERAEPILSDPDAAKYVWGVGFHWYSGDQFDHLAKVHDAFPQTKLLFTEGCQEGGLHLGSWDIGERYGHDIIGDLNNWTVGWIDWNMVLDERGGPNHVDNLCDAPIIADTVRDKLYFENSYYYMGHFSKFIRPGAVRIGCESTNPSLEATAFRNVDGRTVVVVMNRTEHELPFKLRADGSTGLKSPPHSIMSIVY